MDSKAHWESVYRSRRAEHVSWFQQEPTVSRDLIVKAAPDRAARIIDVGGGASTLVDVLRVAGYSNITVMDLSATALAIARTRLGVEAGSVTWIVADVLEADLPEAGFDLWHDRAVFHFLTDPAERARYVDAVRRSVRSGGHIVVATFGPHGPDTCSGLEVARFSADEIHPEFGEGFAKIGDAQEIHNTPSGTEQEFVYCYCRLPK